MTDYLLSVIAAAVALLGGLVYLRARRVETVYPWEAALLYVNGAFARQLPAGRHVLFSLGRTIRLDRVQLWDQALPLGAIDVLTSDRFGARFSPTAILKITDPRGRGRGSLPASHATPAGGR